MMIFRLGILTVAIVVLSGPISAQEVDKVSSMTVMDGICHELMISNADASDLCLGKLVNIAYESGHSSFQFVAEDKAVIGFYGQDERAVGNKASLTVEKITLNLMMGTPSTSADATGKCTYTNPYAGPSRVQCSATSAGRTFSAIFVSDGNEPNVTEF